MALDPAVLYIIGSYNVGQNNGAIWKWDGVNIVLVDDIVVAGEDTSLTGGVVFSGDNCLYCSGWYYDGATDHTGIIWKWDGAAFAIEYHDTAAETRICDICEFGGALYAIHRKSGGNTTVLKRTGAGVWVEVLDTTQAAYLSGIFKMVGNGGTEYLIAWSDISAPGNAKFHFSLDGAAWTSAGDLGIGGWGHLSYLFWDDDNATYRAGVGFSVANERISVTMVAGTWADGGAHGHATAPYTGWGDIHKDTALDVRVGLAACARIEKFTGAVPWVSDGALAAGAPAVGEYSRACWAEWDGDLYFAAATGGSVVSLYNQSGGWVALDTCGANTTVGDLAYLAGPNWPAFPLATGHQLDVQSIGGMEHHGW